MLTGRDVVFLVANTTIGPLMTPTDAVARYGKGGSVPA